MQVLEKKGTAVYVVFLIHRMAKSRSELPTAVQRPRSVPIPPSLPRYFEGGRFDYENNSSLCLPTPEHMLVVEPTKHHQYQIILVKVTSLFPGQPAAT